MLPRWVSLHVGVAVTSFAILAGCSGKVVGTDLTRQPNPTDPSDPSDPTDPNRLDEPPQCASVAAVCDPGDVSFASDAACGKSGAAYCYSRSGKCRTSTIWCGHMGGDQCGALPACDAGDEEVLGCPPGPPPGPGNGIVCYPRTACGATIVCLHRSGCTALPQCDPGDKQVGDASQCFQNPPLSCYSRDLCGVKITCARP